MEVTKKVGGPDPSGPQGHPSVGSQQVGGGLRGSQGPWTNSGSVYSRQGLSLSTKAISDGAYGTASQAHTHEPSHQQLRDPAEVSSQCGSERASQDSLRLPSISSFPSSNVGAQTHLVMENRSLALPVCRRNDGTSDMAQHRLCCSRLQVQMAGEGKTPAKVLVGWGRGPCSPGQIASLGIRKSRWLPYFLSGEDGSAAAQSPLLAPTQDQGPGKCPCPAQTPPTPTPARANTPALDTISTSAAVESYTCNLDHVTNTNAITKGLSPDLLPRKCDNQWSAQSSSSKGVTSCQDKVNFHSQDEPPTPALTPRESPDQAQELKFARSLVLPRQPENQVEKPLISRSGSPKPDSGPPETPKPQRGNQEIYSSQPGQQPFNVCNNTCSNMLPSAHQVTCHNPPQVQPPRETMQIPPSSAPTCQLQDAVEDRVLVFDMATGNTRMGLLCHDPMGSRAVLVGLMPSHPSIYASENTLSTWPLAMPILSPDSDRCSFWSTTPMVSSPVPSSLSSGSYQEVALVPKEARLNLESQGSPGTETPIRMGMLTGPVPLGMPLQFGERILSHAHDPGWSDAEKNEASHTIWMLDASGMQDTSMVQDKKLQWMNSEQTPEPVPPAKNQEVLRPLLQENTGSHNQKEVVIAHPDNAQVQGAGQAPLGGQPPLAEQHPLSRQRPSTGQPPSAEQCPLTGQTHLSGQPPLAEQTPSTKQPPLPGRAPLTGSPIARQRSLTMQPPFPQEPPISNEPTLSRGPLTTREAGQASTLGQGGEPLGPPTHAEVLPVTPAPEETCVYVNREKVGVSAGQSSSSHGLSSWQPSSSLITFTTPGPGCKVLPMARVGTEAQGPRFELTAEDITHSPVAAHLGLLRGACYELVPTMDVLSVQSPVLCHHLLGPYQDMAAVVIDTGTGFTKCGLAGEDHVLSVLPSRVQLLQHPVQGQPRYAVPENREGSYSVLNRGVVSDWDALEVLWQHLFYCRLGVQPEELAVLVADSPTSPRTNREKVAEILFERFHVPAMQTVHQALLALYAYGRTTGLVLGSGHGTSYVAPIVTGDLAPFDTYRLDVAGADLTEYLAQLLLAGSQSLLKAGLVNQIKEACCYVAKDMTAEMVRAQARVDFVLPDKQVITLGSERFRCPEALFQPNLLGLNQPGLPQLALLSISRLEAKQQEQLLANVVLDGGSTLLSGFPERLRQELGPGATVLGSPHRAVAAWLGGSIMVSRDSFRSLWLSRREYEEEGPWAIYKYHL